MTFVIHRTALIAMTWPDLKRSFQLSATTSFIWSYREKVQQIAYETNENDRLSCYFYCRVRTKDFSRLFMVT